MKVVSSLEIHPATEFEAGGFFLWSLSHLKAYRHIRKEVIKKPLGSCWRPMGDSREFLRQDKEASVDVSGSYVIVPHTLHGICRPARPPFHHSTLTPHHASPQP